MTGGINTHYRNCNLCEAMCGLEIKVQGNHVLSIKGDSRDPFSQGHICPKAVALQDIYADPDRLKRPVRRSKNGWEEIGWEEAFDEAARNLKAIQRQYGKNAVAVYSGNPVAHNTGSMLFNGPFIRSLHTKNRYSASSVDQLPHHYAAYFMFGHQLLIPIPDIDRTQFMLILGANPLASNGSLMSAPGAAKRLQALRARGGKLVVVDPRHTETAAKADQHLFIRPSADALFLLAILHTLFDEGLTRPGRLESFTDGIDTMQRLVVPFAPEEVAAVTGIEAAAMRQLARDFAGAESAVCYGRMGVSTQTFGGLCQWLINVLNIVSGNLDRPGGAMFAAPAIDILKTGTSPGHYNRWRSRVRGLPEFGGELPVSTLAEEILTEGEGQIKALVTNAGNPVLSTPNGRQLEAALSGLEFMLAIDIYVNETTRHAHIILPPATGLETEHYDLAFHLFGVRNTAKYSPAIFEAAPDAKYDWEILLELQTRMQAGGKAGQLVQRIKRNLRKQLPPQRIVDLGLRFGPYGVWGRGRYAKTNLSLGKLKRNAHGIDLGALRPCLPGRLFTSAKRINLTPRIFVSDIERLKALLTEQSAAPGKGYDLFLIGRRHLRSNNSWMHNSQRLVKGPERCTLLIHPADAADRQISSGQMVVVHSRVGSITLPAETSDEMMPGVISIPHGWGHHRPGIQLSVARQRPGVSINDITDDTRFDRLTGNAAFSGVPVSVSLLSPRQSQQNASVLT